MALINCPECNKEISDTTKSCPNCGYRFKKQVNRNMITSIVIILCIVLVFPVCYFTPKLVKYYSIDKEVRQCAVKFIKTIDAYNDGDLSFKEANEKLKELSNRANYLDKKLDIKQITEFSICHSIIRGSLSFYLGSADDERNAVADLIGYIK